MTNTDKSLEGSFRLPSRQQPWQVSFRYLRKNLELTVNPRVVMIEARTAKPGRPRLRIHSCLPEEWDGITLFVYRKKNGSLKANLSLPTGGFFANSMGRRFIHMRSEKDIERFMHECYQRYQWSKA